MLSGVMQKTIRSSVPRLAKDYSKKRATCDVCMILIYLILIRAGKTVKKYVVKGGVEGS